MPLPNITLAQFNAISNGDYNAGQIDFATGRNGETELVKINNHEVRSPRTRPTTAAERKAPAMKDDAKNTAAETSSYRIDIGVQPSFAGCAPRAILI